MDASTGKLTFERLASLPDDDLRHELIDGVHFATGSPGLPHQVVLGNLYLAMWTFAQAFAARRLRLR